MNRSLCVDEVVAVLELVQVALHVAVEVALDVALHDRLGIDVDAGAVDAGDPLADQFSVHEHPGVVASRMGQPGHAQHPVAQRLLDIGPVLNGVVERHVARPDQGFDRGDVGVANLPKSMCRHGLSLFIEPQNDFFLMPTSANVAPRRKSCSGYLDRSRLAPRVPGASGPFEVAPTAVRLLVSHRVPLGLRHRDPDGDHVVERIEGIECLLLLIGHCHISRTSRLSDSMRRDTVFDASSTLLVFRNRHATTEQAILSLLLTTVQS